MALLSQNPEDRRQLGERLAIFVRSSSFRIAGSNALVGVIADLVADDPDMGPPLRDLVTRPIFQDLLPSASKGGAGATVQRDSLLNELSRTYNHDVVTALEDVLNGFLDVPNSIDSPQVKSMHEVTEFTESSHEVVDENHNEHDKSQSEFDHLRDLLTVKEWHKADQQTWSIILSCVAATHGFIPDQEWSLIPCDVIQEIDRMWSEASSFRYGFSIQKAIWEEIVSQIRKHESYESVELSITPVEIFYSLLRSEEAKQDYFSPGFFPGYGVREEWDSSQDQWILEESDSGLISSFDLLFEKLRSCKLPFDEITLDSRTVAAVANYISRAPFNPNQEPSQPAATQHGSVSPEPVEGQPGCTGLFLFLLAIVTLAGIAATLQESSFSIDQQKPGVSLQAVSRKLDSLQKELSKAVLICEIKPLINQIQKVQTKGITTEIDTIKRRKESMIANANKRIEFLDATGKDKYWENGDCTYGLQYFDDPRDPGNPDLSRAFVAVSQTCNNPRLLVEFSATNNSNFLPKYDYIKPIPNHRVGTLKFPPPEFATAGGSWWYRPSVLCS